MGFTDFNLAEEETKFFSAIEFLKGHQLINSEYFIHDCINKGQKILAEGAQGSLLDVEFGTYPFVTSSNTLAGGVCTGLGVAPKHVGKVYGIFKAYSTRVGSGPFPTELNDETGEYLRIKGHEFGATTGRKRRTGWIDLVALKYTCMLNGVDELIMMKSDVLNGMDQIAACTAYSIHGERSEQVPSNLCNSSIEPILEWFPGWGEDLSHTQGFEAMDERFRNYVHFVENYLGTKIRVISLGPERESTLVKD